MQQIVAASHSKMRVLVASIRDPTDMATLAAAGCDTFTFSPAIAEKLFVLPATVKAAADFEVAAARNAGPRGSDRRRGSPKPEKDTASRNSQGSAGSQGIVKA